MRTKDDIERYLALLGHDFDEVAEDTWVVHVDEDGPNIVVRYEPPLVVFRMKVMPVPEHDQLELMKTLLELNATEVVHGAFGLEGQNVVMTCSLQVENLDQNEFEAAIDSMSMAVAQNRERLSAFVEKQ